MVSAVGKALQEAKMTRRRASHAAAFNGARVGKAVWAAVLAVAFAWLAGCSDTTPYRPAVRGEGYSDEQVGPGRFRVTFVGNTVTDRQTVEDYMMYRAAEVTLNAGRERFTVLEKDVDRITSERVIFEGPAGRNTTDGDRTLDRDASFSRPVHRYRAVAVIAVEGRDGAIPDGERRFDAREVMSRLGSRIGKPDRS
jgi:hypothetical protein